MARTRILVSLVVPALLSAGALAGCGAKSADESVVGGPANEPAGCTPQGGREAADPASTLATLHTSEGDISVKLFPKRAPETVANFVGLGDGSKEWSDQSGDEPLYDCTIFHRVINGFMIQGGDPDGTGFGGPGYTFKDEVHADDDFNRPYLLAMANGGPGTNGSQFFITVGATDWLNGLHTIFGEVTDGQEVVDAIATTAVGPDGQTPVEDVVLESVTFE